MHTAAAAKTDQCKVARVVAAIDGDELDSVDHIVVGDADDAARCFLPVGVEGRGQLIQCTVHRVHVRFQRAAAEILRVNATQRQVRVGRRRFGAADAIRDWAGHGAGAMGADVEPLEFVHPGDGSASLTDFHQIDDRHHHRVAG